VSPWVGRLVDRNGQTTVLRVAVVLNAGALTTFGLLAHGTPFGLLVACAAVSGAAAPPIGACMRTLYPALVDGELLHRVFAIESAALELTYILGPLLMLAVASLAGTGTALVVSAAALGGGTLVFSATRESRAWRAPAAGVVRRRGGALRSPGLQTIAIAIALAGATFGAIEVAVPAACQAAGSKGATGPLLAIWGLGSMLGGLLAALAAAPADAAHWIVLLLAGLGVGDLALIPVSALSALAPLLLVAGAAIAPLLGIAYSVVDRVTPSGGQTEAFAWLTTAIGVGISGGSALAGALVDAGGPGAGFAAAAAVGLVGCAITSARRGSLAAPALAAGNP
jgi:predicted MFS family arabinose efflux permease